MVLQHLFDLGIEVISSQRMEILFLVERLGRILRGLAGTGFSSLFGRIP